MLAILLATAWIASAQPSSPASSPSLDLTPGPGGIIRCATPKVSTAEAAAVESRITAFRGTEATFRVTIPIAFHIITCSGQGDATQAQIDAQVRELNSAYRGTGFSFTLASVDRTENCQWFSQLTSPGMEKKMKQALAIDPAHRFNVYTADLGKGFLGWAYFPQQFPEDSYYHGVVMHYATLPGGTLTPYNAGGTLDHETGHYLGLYHTFQGGCADPGDYVADTPFEASPAFGCPVGRNTCPQPGDDPIHDYMDYTDDACYTLFTAGQAARMQTIVPVYRPSLFATALQAASGAPQSSSDASDARLAGVAFRGAWPNPFSTATLLRFALPKTGPVTLELLDVAGKRVAVLADGVMTAGEHGVPLAAGTLDPGVYFAILRLEGVAFTRTVVLVR